MKFKKNLNGVILAGGESKRMGRDKLYLKIKEKTFVEIIVQNLSKAPIDKIFLLTSKEIENFFKIKLLDIFSKIEFLINPNPEFGQLSSLQIAIKNLWENCSGVLMCLVDHPAVKNSTYKKLISLHLKNPQKIIIPVYNGKRGHPVVFPKNVFNDIINFSLTKTTRDIIYKNKELIFEVPLEDKGIVFNINTIEDYEKLLNTEENGKHW